MRRYRVMSGPFDTRAHILVQVIDAEWEPAVQRQWRENQRAVREGLIVQYGIADYERKLADFLALGVEPFSVVAFHNTFFRQSRDAFVVASYYPALTSACALGERVLNHTVRTLRDSFRHTDEYKEVHGKASFDNWPRVVRVLEAWDVLLPDATDAFRRLKQQRDAALHFRPDTDTNARELALAALTTLREIIEGQFGALTPKPWYMSDTPGETFIRASSQDDPFVREVILPSPSALLVGPRHELEADPAAQIGFVLVDVGDAGPEVGSDEEFLALRYE